MAKKNPKKQALEAGKGNRLSDKAYSRFLDLLFEQRLPSGAVLSQRELIEIIGVPVTPLRDALRVLESDGLIVIHPRTGIEIIEPGLHVVRSTYQFRSIIESAALEVYAEVATEAELTELEQRHRTLIELVRTAGYSEQTSAEFDRLEDLLHYGIVRSLANPLVENAYRRIHNHLRLLRVNRRWTAASAARSLEEHLSIILACKARDTKAAVSALRSHFNSAVGRLFGIL
jgi:DNA-binding GntR family transcriptional regulator